MAARSSRAKVGTCWSVEGSGPRRCPNMAAGNNSAKVSGRRSSRTWVSRRTDDMLRYPVKLTRDDNGTILVTAPDLPEVSTFGEDATDALVRAADAIATALQGRITAREKIPAPSAPRRGQRLVALPAIVAAKLELYRGMIQTNTR